MKNKIYFEQFSNDELKSMAEGITLELKRRNIVTDAEKRSAKIALVELRKILSSIREDYCLSICNEQDVLEIIPTDKITICIGDEEGDDYTLISEEEED